MDALGKMRSRRATLILLLLSKLPRAILKTIGDKNNSDLLSLSLYKDNEYLRNSRGNLTVTNLSRNTTRVFPVSQDIMVLKFSPIFSCTFYLY